MTTNTQSIDDMINQLKLQNAREALVYARNILERAMHELDTYID